jgi:predicted Fe-S protein YdhL (DUF1289 family)
MKPLRKMTLAQAEKIARAKDPALWASLTPKERREVVAEFNAHLAAEAAKAKATVDTDAFIRRQMRPRKR